ncbi:hypothetical protein [Neobacillus fumarioli]|uniref:hypothetical protein n=1 Tax=Neobacillus fumarioli TaxID=105229 RepID=UPI000833D261|nr:hypothetical protein [Neobacillus fumarioli]
MRTPNYHEFYELAFIPIGLNDFLALKETEAYDEAFSHWLIAVEGVQLDHKYIYFHWKVSIYPATIDRDFNWKKPYYYSANMKSMDQAISLASTFVAASKQDQLSPAILLAKIS